MRRKPKENNFKAILDCIRALMTTPLVVPEWLQDVLLGYGDPAAASYPNLPPEQQVTRHRRSRHLPRPRVTSRDLA